MFEATDIDGVKRQGDYVRKYESGMTAEDLYPGNSELKHYIVDYTSETWEFYEIDLMTLQQVAFLDK